MSTETRKPYATTDEDGEVAFVLHTPDTETAEDASIFLRIEATRWGTPLCALCLVEPVLHAYVDDPHDEERRELVPLGDPREEYREWFFSDIAWEPDCRRGGHASGEIESLTAGQEQKR